MGRREVRGLPLGGTPTFLGRLTSTERRGLSTPLPPPWLLLSHNPQQVPGTLVQEPVAGRACDWCCLGPGVLALLLAGVRAALSGLKPWGHPGSFSWP